MARIEIKDSPVEAELERIAIFLKDNYIHHRIAPDFGNHSKEDLQKYKKLMTKYNSEEQLNGIGHD